MDNYKKLGALLDEAQQIAKALVAEGTPVSEQLATVAARTFCTAVENAYDEFLETVYPSDADEDEAA